MTTPHISVLLDKVIEILGDINGKTIIDATFGAGGYSHRFLELGANVIAFDRDPSVQKFADILSKKYLARFQFINSSFSNIDNPALVDAIVFDLGISSMQIDTPERGFSWRFDALLDMRMGVGITAAELIKNTTASELAKILKSYGDVKKAGIIARAIKTALPETTFQLKDLIHNPKDIAPVFQAIRIALNEEMDELEQALSAAPNLLAPNGICAAVTFHSLEDRIVKQKFRELTTPIGDPRFPTQPAAFLPLKTYRPDTVELETNPRARSAHLRVIKRVAKIAKN